MSTHNPPDITISLSNSQSAPHSPYTDSVQFSPQEEIYELVTETGMVAAPSTANPTSGMIRWNPTTLKIEQQMNNVEEAHINVVDSKSENGDRAVTDVGLFSVTSKRFTNNVSSPIVIGSDSSTRFMPQVQIIEHSYSSSSSLSTSPFFLSAQQRTNNYTQDRSTLARQEPALPIRSHYRSA